MTQSYLEAVAASKGALAVTVVVPAKDEAENLPILLDEIEAALQGRRFEVIVIETARPTVRISCCRITRQPMTGCGRSGTRSLVARAARCVPVF